MQRSLLRLIPRTRHDRGRVSGLACCCLIAAVLGISGLCAWGQLPLRGAKKDRPRLPHEEIVRGSAEQAGAYGKKIARELGFVADKTPESLDELLAWAGFSALKAVDIEKLDSETLMNYDRLAAAVSNASEFRTAFAAASWEDDTLLATRFFAPKTTDASGFEKHVRLSWRKVVRLKARPRSGARLAGIAAVYLAGNIYTSDLQKSPFSVEAKNNQVILVRKQPATGAKAAAYWLVYGPLSKGGLLTQYTETSWDAIEPAEGPDAKSKTPMKKYFAPDACMQCHGSAPESAMLSYLDTDYWLDRSLDDFPQVESSPWGVLFDGGKDPLAPRYRQAMDVLRKLNAEIAAQNRSVDPQAFQLRAVENWRRLHARDDAHLAPLRRGIASADGKRVWNDDNPTDRQLLPLLNHYCFRCHSNLYYHVFDKAAVIDRIDMMILFIDQGDMPKDRVLDKETRKQMIDLLQKLQKENP